MMCNPYKKFMIWLGLGVCLAGLTDLGAYSLYLKKDVAVQGKVRLGDIARIENATHPEALQNKVVVAKLEVPLYIRAADLKQALRKGPEDLQRVYGQGVWLIPGGRSLNSAALQTELLQQCARIQDADQYLKNLQIQIDPGQTVDVPQAGVELKFVLPHSARSLSAGKRILAFDIYNASAPRKLLKRHQLHLTIKRWMKVPVARRSIPVGTRLNQDLVQWERRAMLDDSQEFIKENLAGQRAVRALRAGDLLTVRQVQYRPAVRRGQSMQLVYIGSGIVLRIRSIAEKAGEVGDLIPVRVLLPGGRRGRRLQARIVSQDAVSFEKAGTL